MIGGGDDGKTILVKVYPDLAPQNPYSSNEGLLKDKEATYSTPSRTVTNSKQLDENTTQVTKTTRRTSNDEFLYWHKQDVKAKCGDGRRKDAGGKTDPNSGTDLSCTQTTSFQGWFDFYGTGALDLVDGFSSGFIDGFSSAKASDFGISAGGAFQFGEFGDQRFSASANYGSLQYPEYMHVMRPTGNSPHIHEGALKIGYAIRFMPTLENASTEQVGAYFNLFGADQILLDIPSFTAYPTNDVSFGLYFTQTTGSAFSYAFDARVLGAGYNVGLITPFSGPPPTTKESENQAVTLSSDNPAYAHMDDAMRVPYLQLGASTSFEALGGRFEAAGYTRLLLKSGLGDPLAEDDFWPAFVLQYKLAIDDVTGMPSTITAEGMVSSSLFADDGYGNTMRAYAALRGWFNPWQNGAFDVAIAYATEMPWGDSLQADTTITTPVDCPDGASGTCVKHDLYETTPYYRDGGDTFSIAGRYMHSLVLDWSAVLKVGGTAALIADPSGVGFFLGVSADVSLDLTKDLLNL